MASSLKAPEPFSFSAPDLAAQWSVWKRQFEYIVETKTGQTPPEEGMLVDVLITLLGSEGLKMGGRRWTPKTQDPSVF